MTDGELIDAITECADALADLCEAKGLRHPKHAQHIKPARAKIKAVMVHFFERQQKAVLAAVKPHIERQLMLHPKVQESYDNRTCTPLSLQIMVAERDRLERIVDGLTPLREAITPAGRTFARSLMPTSLHPLTFSATAGETSEYNEAISGLISAAAKSLGETEGPDFAGDYLAKNSLSKLTGGLNDTSIERLQDALSAAWDKGGDYDSMVSAITDTFDDFTTTRAELIAQQETSTAYNSARQSIAEAAGLDEKSSEIESDNPCEDCEENEAAEWIDVEDDFPNGGDAPPFHVGCMCVVNFRKTSAEDDEEE